MGTSRSAGELAHKLGRLAGDCRDLEKVMTVEATALVRGGVEAALPKRLRGVGKKGSPIRVISTVRGTADGDTEGHVFTKGQTQLIERNTRAHVIPRQRGARARKRVVVIPNVGVRASANHPGTKGKHLFAKAVTATTSAVKRLYESQTALAIRRIF